MTKRSVLNASDIDRALKRIAHEIVEANSGIENLILLGIPTRGVDLADRLAEHLSNISDGQTVLPGVLDITLFRDDLATLGRAVSPSRIPTAGIEDKVVVIVDDVLFSGRTVRAALDAIASIGRPRQVKLAVLVDRGHRQLPIRPDFVGKNLPTSIQERVFVRLQATEGVDEVVIES
ncbi:MAG: bifunctional pyr operon transcriptional regulator/uracil phosphoribosyltransferase PyrR [Aquiluna sp.]|nr:bifunctional pyr operon transcriptional regulator/uracil phosphoribosyltransferase PyrR [Aquiluna sp.]